MIILCTLSFYRLMYSPYKAVLQIPKLILLTYAVVCAIWYHPYNLKNVKNSHGEVLLLVKLQAEAFQIVHMVLNCAKHHKRKKFIARN